VDLDAKTEDGYISSPSSRIKVYLSVDSVYSKFVAINYSGVISSTTEKQE